MRELGHSVVETSDLSVRLLRRVDTSRGRARSTTGVVERDTAGAKRPIERASDVALGPTG
jgi:hypothetical protein